MKGESVGSWKLTEKCFDLDLKGSHKWVLTVLCSHYPNIFPSEARIAKEAGIGLTAVKGAIKYLEREGWIKRQPRYSKSTVYTVNVERIMATPPCMLRIPAVEGGLPFPGPEPDRTAQPPESAGIRPSEPAQTAGIRPINSRNPATNRQDNKQLLTDNRNKPENASEQKYTKDIESTNHASKGFDASIVIESDDYQVHASSSDLTVDAQSAVRPSCASAKTKDGDVEEHGNRADLLIPIDDTGACQQELDTTTSPLPAGLSDVSNTTASPGGWIDDGIIADDTEDDPQGNTIETRACPLNGEADPGHEPEYAVTSLQQPVPESPLSKPDQPEAPPAPTPEPKPACKYRISEGPVCWFIEDKDGKTVARAPTKEQAILTALRMSATPHDRFLASKSEGVYKVFDTRRGVAKVVKTCATAKEAIEEAERLSKES